MPHPDPSDSPDPALTAARLAAIVESSGDAIIGKDLDGTIRSWNRGAEAIFGYTVAEIVGTSIRRLVPPERQEEEDRILAQLRRGERVEPFETERLTKDGRRLEVSITASPIRDGDGRIVGASKIVRDITPARQRERELARLARLYAGLSQVNQAIVMSPTRDALFAKICGALVDFTGFKLVWIGRHDEAAHQLVSVAVGGDEHGYLRHLAVYTDDRPEGRGPTGTAFRENQPCICNDLLNDSIAFPWRDSMQARGLRASAAFPIHERGRPWGTLSVYAGEPHFFRDREIALLKEAAGDISFALDNFVRADERARADEKVRQERDFSAALINSLPGVIYFYDDTGRFLRWNDNFERVTGYTGAELATMHPLDFFAGDDKERVAARIGEVFTKGEASVEAGFLTKDGRVIPYYFTGVRTIFEGKPCLVGVGIDISQRKAAEAALHESQARFAAVVENLREGLIIADPAGDYLHWNPAALRMLGFADPQEGTRRQREFDRIFELFTAGGRALPPAEWPLARARRGDAYEGLELRVRRRDADWERIFSYSGTQVRFADGRVLAFVTLHDVTERKRAERALGEAHEQLEQKVAQRTEELRVALERAEAADRVKSAFLATMSHELRTPLNSIIGFTGIVLQGLAGPLNAEQTKQLGMVRGSARHLLELINDVLDISKIEAGQLDVHAEPFDLRASLERMTGLVRPMAEKKGLQLSVAVTPEIGELVSDRRRTEQILLNLLNNAVKFTDQGAVSLSAARVDGFRPTPGAAPVAAVEVRIADTGVGIKPEDLPKLFQPFRQIDSGLTRLHEGTGLGLAICRRLTTMLGGTIVATSEWSRGSVFTLTLPEAKHG